jgi:hypothetical protein
MDHRSGKAVRKTARSGDLAEWGRDLAEWLERLTANAEVATVLNYIPASPDTVECEWLQIKQS